LAERIFLPAGKNDYSSDKMEEDYHDEIAKIFEKDGFYSTYMMAQSWQNKILPRCEVCKLIIIFSKGSILFYSKKELIYQIFHVEKL
jgi:hypothetical protein